MAPNQQITIDGGRICFDVSTWPLEPSVRGRALYFLSRRIKQSETYGTFKFAGYLWVWQRDQDNTTTLYIARDLLMEASNG